MSLQKQYDCRFCLQTDKKPNLLAPCLCKGSFKYVHNVCLLEWYIHAPSNGDKCSVCSYIYHRDHTIALEEWATTTLFVNLHLFYPFPMILFSHWFYFTLVSYANLPLSDFAYSLYQLVWHFAMSIEFLRAVYRIHNRRAYAIQWQQVPRPLLPMIHSYLLLILPKTGVLGGIAANMCMVYYFYEHRRIIDQMNTTYQPRFVSRPKIKN